jgi:hypothetical protein
MHAKGRMYTQKRPETVKHSFLADSAVHHEQEAKTKSQFESLA